MRKDKGRSVQFERASHKLSRKDGGFVQCAITHKLVGYQTTDGIEKHCAHVLASKMSKP